MRTLGFGSWFALGITVAIAAVYSPVGEHSFVDYDDLRYVVENPHLRSGLHWQGLVQDLSEPFFGNWIPLTSLSLRIDYALFGLWAPGYVLHNVALHILASLLLYAALQRMTGARGRSAYVAAVFALHPLHVESVAWVSERKDVLSGALAMATLYLYARYAEGPTRVRRFLPVMLVFSAGLLAKSMLVTLPLVLLLLDVWPLARIRLHPLDLGALGARTLEKLPLLALAAVVSVVTLQVQSSAGAVYPSEHLPLDARLLNALDSYWVYLRQSLWPSDLAAFYLHPLQLVDPSRAALAGTLLVALSAACLWSLERRPYLAVGWFWYLGTLIPVIGIIQVGMQAHADRYVYIPQIGLCIALSWGMCDLWGETRRTRLRLAAVAVGSLAILAGVAHHQVGFWRDSTTLHEHIVEVNPESYRSLNHLGRAYMKHGRLDEAKELFVQSMRRAPTWAPPRIGLGDVALQRGDPEGAIRLYEIGRELDPNSLSAYNSLSVALRQLDRVDEAREQLEQAVDRARPAEDANSEIAYAHRELAKILRDDGESEASVRHLEIVRRLAPDDPETRIVLSSLHVESGRWDEARSLLADSTLDGSLSAEFFRVQAHLAEHDGSPERALVQYQIARTIDPDSLVTALGLFQLLHHHPDLGDAVAALDNAEAIAARTKIRNRALLAALTRARETRGRPALQPSSGAKR